MSKLAQYKALEAQLAEQLKQLDALKNDTQLKQEIEFEERLRCLLDEYGFTIREVRLILDPESAREATFKGAQQPQRRERKIKRYKNPETAEIIETKGGNHKMLKEWKQKFGAETVESWRLQ